MAGAAQKPFPRLLVFIPFVPAVQWAATWVYHALTPPYAGCGATQEHVAHEGLLFLACYLFVPGLLAGGLMLWCFARTRLRWRYAVFTAIAAASCVAASCLALIPEFIHMSNRPFYEHECYGESETNIYLDMALPLFTLIYPILLWLGVRVCGKIPFLRPGQEEFPAPGETGDGAGEG
jgi:hypothetical protein